MKNLLSLFDYSGNWSKPYRDAGWNVLQIDIKLGDDILTWDYQQFPREHFNGLLAALPCTAYTKVGCLLWAKKDADGTTEFYNSITRKTLEIIDYFRPGLNFWALENPAGRLDKIFPELKRFRLPSFQPWHFGDPYTKYTVLYGEFSPFLVMKPARFKKKDGRQSGTDSIDSLYNLKGRYADRAAARSITPAGFSQAFFDANH